MFNTSRLSWLLGAALAACGPVTSEPIDDEPLTVSDAGLFVDGELRWSPTATPSLSGTVAIPNTLVEVFAGTERVAQTTAVGTEWTVVIPSDVLGTFASDITFSARGTSITRKLVVDDTPPVLAATPTEIKNELHDVVTLADDGEIISHAHVDDEQTMLGGDGCPDVFKHAYLMDPGDSNPLRWNLAASDDGVGLDPASAMVRIGLRDGSQFGPWRPAVGTEADSTIDFTIEPKRSGETADAFLATAEGPMVIQLAIDDRFGRETILERCWTNHPLAVPLFAENGARPSFGPLSIAGSGPGAIDTQLMSELVNPGSRGLSNTDFDLFNGTDETAFVTFSLTRPTVQTRRAYVHQSATTQVTDLDFPIRCENTNDSRCIALTSPRISELGPTVTESPERYVVRVFRVQPDSLGEEMLCATCDSVAGAWTFPLDRGHYRVMVGFRELRNLFPSKAPDDADEGPFTDTQIATTSGAFSISGRVLGTRIGCTRFADVNGVRFCAQVTDLVEYRALTRVVISSTASGTTRATSAPSATSVSRAVGTLVTPHPIIRSNFDLTNLILPPAF